MSRSDEGSAAAAVAPGGRKGGAYLLLGLLALLWGASFTFVKISVQTLPPLTTMAMRVGIAAALLWLVLARAGIRLFDPTHPWGAVWKQALVMNMVPWTLVAWASQSIDSGLAAILCSVAPVFTFLITRAVTRHESASGARLFGALAGLAGVVLIVGTGLLRGLGEHTLAQLACVCVSFCYALASIHGRRFDGLPPLVPAVATLACSAVVLVPVALVADRPWTLAPSHASLLAAVALAVLSTAIALVVYYRVLATLGSLAAASNGYLRIAVGVGLGILLLDETMTAERFAGFALVLLGVYAMTRPAPR